LDIAAVTATNRKQEQADGRACMASDGDGGLGEEMNEVEATGPDALM
jgi:hypothetical protein